jgi:hypothetical protein
MTREKSLGMVADAGYESASGGIFRRIRRPPATSIAEFETNTGKKPNTVPILPKTSKHHRAKPIVRHQYPDLKLICPQIQGIQ